MTLFEEWWNSIPPVTRSYICLSVLTTSAVALEVITPYKLYLDWALILTQAHVWRLFTNFLFFGNFTLDFLFHMFFLYRYSNLLETNSFRGRTADFLYMLLFGAAWLVLMSPFASIDFLGPSLTFMMVYVWGRRNSRQMVGFLGVLTFRAPYLPWVLLLFSFVFGSSPSMDLLGILAGHVYYYMADVYPAMTGISLLKTPRILKLLVGNNDDFDDHAYQAVPQQADGANARRGGGWGQGRMLDGGANQ
ncbi:Derlin-2.2 [Gracilariopsis chorda]|uniref:Derlin n=1 Tax=Gracilariopsis chorda TaxID=448386 RepID=A0A2V3IEJ2_9FLOR|nr:Derlin-2.2 [Gracilariopsis chorda]|eukprot:PXF40472.1 Derlin-2.2 [Gracilariopsis chorda]